ncbi:MAG: Era-like GTP-binding protein, partial [Proteobacteria bacterium]|nr:Era-like GTP-binding protein [Pseudomonadota bacterium]
MLKTMKAERKRVTFVGRANVGKSSLVNALLEQNLSIVSPIPGTTTDPTEKAIEILPAGPLLFTDTAGIDDKSELGIERLKKVKEVLRRTDLMIIVCAPPFDNFEYEKKLLKEAKDLKIPVTIVVNKIDTFDNSIFDDKYFKEVDIHFVSAKTKQGIRSLKEYIGTALADKNEKGILDGIVKEGD